MMYQTVNFSMFRDAFVAMDRGDQFSYDGLEALYDYLTDFGSDQEPVELDVIALCCEYSEYPTAAAALYEHAPHDFAELLASYSGEDLEYQCEDFIGSQTLLMRHDSGVIIHNF